MTWGLHAAFEDSSGFATEAEWFRFEDGVLHVRTVGLEDRVVEGRCLGLIAIPRGKGARTTDPLHGDASRRWPAFLAGVLFAGVVWLFWEFLATGLYSSW